MDKTKIVDDKIMKLLNVSVISRLICNTNKGEVELRIRKGENTYFLTLDSIPLDKETNKELMDLMFKKDVPQVNKFQEVKERIEVIGELIDKKTDKLISEQITPKKKSYYKSKKK